MEAQLVAAAHELDRLRTEVVDLRASRRRLANADDAERRELERVLHGGVQQHLVALAARLQLAAGLIGVDPAAAEATLAEAAIDVGTAVNEAQDLARRIHPPLLESGGLAVAIRSAATDLNVTTRIDLRSHTAWPPPVARAVYVCCLEMLEHAGAGTQITVTIRDEESAVGFDVLAAPGGSDVDLVRLRDRIEALDGRLTIESLDGGAIRIAGSIPLAG